MPLVTSEGQRRYTNVQTCSGGSVFPERVGVSPGAVSATAYCPWQLQRHSVHRVSKILSQGLRGSVEALSGCNAPLLLALLGNQRVSAC